MIVEVKGPSGAGKTGVVRGVVAGYGSPVTEVRSPRDGRRLAATYRHPAGGAPLTVLGCYGRTGGGCDSLRSSDGGIGRAVALALDAHARGDDVLLEGNALTFDAAATRRLAEGAPLVVVALTTPADGCAADLARRRRLAARDRPALADRVAAEVRRFDAVLDALADAVEILRRDREAAVGTVLDVLAAGGRHAASPAGLAGLPLRASSTSRPRP